MSTGPGSEGETSATRALPSRMRAAVYLGRGQIEVRERALPRLEPDEVLLRVSHCGVCGTDLHLVLDGWGKPSSVGGHEYSGRIAALGSAVAGWRVGDAVVGGPLPSCGRCAACRAGRPALCDAQPPAGVGGFEGAFAEYKKVHQSQLFPVPGALGLREAALAEPLAVALHALSRAPVAPGQRALVSGLGPIGALTLATLRARGVEDVTVSEPRALRRELAAKLGAASVVAPEALAAPPMPFQLVERPVDVVYECSGSPAAFESALAQLRRAGTLVLVGSGMRRPRLDPNRVLLNELVVTGAYNYDAGGFRDALALLASGRLPTQRLLEARDVPLEGLLEAMEGLAEGRIGAKVLVTPN